MLIKDNETELYHSGIYLGKDYSDGIKHWKYIKKETKNGKTRYYYDDPSKAAKKYKKEMDEYQKIMDQADADQKLAVDTIEKEGRYRQYVYENGKKKPVSGADVAIKSLYNDGPKNVLLNDIYRKADRNKATANFKRQVVEMQYNEAREEADRKSIRAAIRRGIAKMTVNALNAVVPTGKKIIKKLFG